MMSVWTRELRRSLSTYTAYWILLLLVFCLSTAALQYVRFDLFYGMRQRQQFNENLYGIRLHAVQPVMDAGTAEMSRFLEDDGMLDSVKSFVRAVHRHPDWIAYEAVPLPFFPDEHATPLPPVFYEVPASDVGGEAAGERPAPALSSRAVTANVRDVFDLGISEGRWFSDRGTVAAEATEGVAYEAEVPVEAVLGAAFRDHVQLGDRLPGSWQGETMELTVVGFLAPGALIPGSAGSSASGAEVLDRSILLPAFSTVRSCHSMGGNTADFERAIYMNRAAPLLVVPEDGGDPDDAVFALARRTGSFTVRTNQVTWTGMETLESISRHSLTLTLALAGGALLVVILAVATLVRARFRSSRHVYAIHMLCGAGPGRIAGFLLSELLLLVLPAALLSLSVLKPLYAGALPLPMVLPAMGGMAVLVLTVGALTIRVQLQGMRPARQLRAARN